MIYQFEYKIDTTKQIKDIFNGVLTLDIGSYKCPINNEQFRIENITEIIKELYKLDNNDKVDILKISKSQYNFIWKVVTEEYL